MKARSVSGWLTLVLLALVLAPRGAFAQAAIYTAGDAGAATTVLLGKEVCGTSTASMVSENAVSYSTMSASDTAELVPAVRGSVPNPMGRDTSAATAGRWGVTVVNPGRTPLNVTQVQIDDGIAGLFNGISMVQPSSGWTATNDVITWAGSLDVPAQSTVDFIVQIVPRNRTGTANVTLRATTSAGVLTGSAFSTAERNTNLEPYVSLPFVVNGLDVFSANTANGGAIETGQMQVFQVRVKESEAGNTQPIPVGSTLTITVPAGWTSVTASSGQTGFNGPVVTAPTACTAGSIVTTLSQTILNNSRVFQFTATSPANAGGVGLYPFVARITGTASDPIDTRTEFTQEVGIPIPGGTQAGITALAAEFSAPNPMGSKKNSIWGAAIANPLATPFTVTRVDITMVNGEQFFGAVTPMRPTTGWTRVSQSNVRWTGSLTIDPHDALDFFVQIQANNTNGTDRPVRLSINNGVLTRDAITSSRTGNGEVCANLFYLASGQPAVYTFGVVAGQPKTFTAAIRETGAANVNAGAELKIVIPAGWSAVTASTTQAGFNARTLIQPTPSVPGEIRTTTSTAFSNGQRAFQFTATAPPNLLDSLYVFPTTLTSSQVRSICTDMVALVTDDSGGLEVEHLSPPVSEATINQIDVQAVASASTDTSFTASIYNFSAAAWEPLVTATRTVAPTTTLSSITLNLDRYFDAPLASTSKHLRLKMKGSSKDNYRFDEDYVAFIVSQYRLLPTDRAPLNTFRGAMSVPMLGLHFSTDTGSVDLYTIKVTGAGSDFLNDVTQVHLVQDLNCNGAVDPGDVDLAAAPFLPAGTVTFGTAPTPLVSFASGNPACAIVAYDISASATAFDIVSAHIVGGFDLTSSVGPLYPFPAVGGFPISSSDSLIPGGPPDLAITKSLGPPLVPPATAYPVGTTVTYQIDVSNLGESPSTNVVLSDVLDASFAPFTGIVTPLDGGVLCVPPTCTPARIDWPSIATLAGNSAQIATVHFQATLPNTVPDGTNVPNTASAVSTEQPNGAVSNATNLPVCAPVLELTKSLPASPADYAVGEVIQWTITLRNTGSCPANNVVLTDVVDTTNLDEASLVFNPVGSYNAATDTQTWSLASLAANATATLTVQGIILPVAQTHTLCNNATAMWNEALAPLASNPPGGSCTTVPVVPPRCTQSLVVNKTLPLSPPDYAEGEPIEWTITVQNNGTCAATGVTVRDTIDTSILEAPFTFTPATGVFDVPSSTYTWPATSVAGSGSQVQTYRVQGVVKAGSEGLTVCDTAVVSFDQGPAVVSNPTSGTCTSVPIIPPRCASATMAGVLGLRAAKTNVVDIAFSWTGPAAPEQHLNSVLLKRDIPNAKRSPTGMGLGVCTNPTAGCTVAGAVTAPPTSVFYQAFGACGSLGSDEGGF